MPKVMQNFIDSKVLDKAMYLFWEKGFFNVSIDNLIEGTGFNRAAIYKHFGGKRGLFVVMLKRYRNEITPQFTAHLENQNGLQAIENFFNQFLHLDKTKMPFGCFLIATASDLPSHDSEIAEIIHDFSRHLHKLFLKQLKSIMRDRSFSKEMSETTIADFLVGNVYGLLTLHRTGSAKKMMKNQIDSIKKFLSIITQDKAI